MRNLKRRNYLLLSAVWFGLSGFAADTVRLNITNGCASICVPTLRDWQYVVEVSDDLRTWAALKGGILGTGEDLVCTNSFKDASHRFYRSRRSNILSISFDQQCFEIGSEWTYSVSETVAGEGSNYTRVERNDRYVVKNGYNSIECNAYSNGTTWLDTEYILADQSNGLFVVGSKDPDSGENLYNPPKSLSFNRFVSGVPSTPVTLPSPETGFSEQTYWEILSVDYGTVTVPAGSFQNTIKVTEHTTGFYNTYGISYEIVSETWYAKEVGEIKSTMTWDFEILGNFATGVSELISYSLK